MNHSSNPGLANDVGAPGSFTSPDSTCEASAVGNRQTHAHLGLWDAVSIIIGIVIGTSIFRTPQLVFGGVSGPWQGMACWALGGLLALIGSLCYAELATSYPRNGGQYVYLSRAYGGWVGFLFGWAQLAVILTGSMGAMAYAFADYSLAFWSLDASWAVWLAAGSVIVLTALNLLGVMCGKTVQNILSAVKVLGLAGIVVAGLIWGGGQSLDGAAPFPGLGFGLSMVFVLYAFGGWSDAAYVAAEVRNQRRNIPLALILGTSGITVVYLLVNAAYLWGLGFEGVRASRTPAADVMQLVMGPWGARGFSLLVMLSALGAINGLIFTGARIYVSMGEDHRLFAWLGRWNSRREAPIWSLLAQSAICLLLIVVVGTQAGQQGIDRLVVAVGLPALPWENFPGFETLVAGSAPAFWVFFLLTGISLFVLRYRDPHLKRPFSVPGYPVTPILFCLTSGYMLYSAIVYAKTLSLLGLVPVAIGLPLYAISQILGPPKKDFLQEKDAWPPMGSGDGP